MAYCRELGLEPREDATNESPAHLRNRVRLELLPLMRELNPAVDLALLRLAGLAAEDDAAPELASLLFGFFDALNIKLQILRGVAGVLFCAAMAWKGSVMTWQAWQHNDRMSTSLGTPMFIPYLFLPIGFMLLGLQYVILLKLGWTPKPKESRIEQQI